MTKLFTSKARSATRIILFGTMGAFLQLAPPAVANNPSASIILKKVSLPMPVLPDVVKAINPFSVKAARNREWVAAQTFALFGPGNSDNGPLVLWERSGSEFVPVGLPETSFVYFPELCAVSDDEVYVAFQDGSQSRARLLARFDGPEVGFKDQPPPQLGGTRHFTSTRLSCFANGNLWLYGSSQEGDDVSSQLPFVFHRPSSSAAWEEIPIPDGISTGGGGVNNAWVRADGSGYYFIVKKLLEISVYLRSAEGKWTEVQPLDPHQVSQVLEVSGNPDNGAVAGVLSPNGARYLKMADGKWKVIALAANGEINATASIGGQFYLGGATQSKASLFRLDSANPLVSQIQGSIHRLEFNESTQKGLAVINDTGAWETDGIYELSFAR